MGYVAVLAPCVRCGNIIHCNPNRVPSVRLKPDGPREPVCRACVAHLNTLREREGMDPIPIDPQAYEAEPEEAIDWS